MLQSYSNSDIFSFNICHIWNRHRCPLLSNLGYGKYKINSIFGVGIQLIFKYLYLEIWELVYIFGLMNEINPTSLTALLSLLGYVELSKFSRCLITDVWNIKAYQCFINIFVIHWRFICFCQLHIQADPDSELVEWHMV